MRNRHAAFVAVNLLGSVLLGGTNGASLAVSVPTTAPLTLYVSPNGKANADGSKGAPFATLKQARDEVRRRRAAGTLSGGAVIELRGGIYPLAETFTLTADDSGTEKSPLLIRAYPGEKPRLIGGARVTDFQTFRDGILKADVSKLGLEALQTPQEEDFNGAIPPFEVFAGGNRLDLARWPNRDPDERAAPGHAPGGAWTYTALIPSKLSDSIWAFPNNTFGYLGDRPAGWKRPEEAQVHLYPMFDFRDQLLGVKSVDAQKKEITLSRKAQYVIRPGRRYYVRNVFEELDTPGEWYWDRREQSLYLKPPADAAARKDVIVTRLSSVLRVEGAANISLVGLTLEAAAGDVVSVRDSRNVRLVGCTVRGAGLGNGVDVKGGEKCGLISCDVYDTGRAGVSLDGGDRKTLTPGNHFVVNSHVHHVGRTLRTYTPAINLNGVACRAANNSIHDGPHAGILYGGNDHIIERNDLGFLMLESADGAAIYTGRDWAARGTVIRQNRIHDLSGWSITSKIGSGKDAPWWDHGPDKNTGEVTYSTRDMAWGIYIDDLQGGVTITDNIFYRIGHAGIHIGGGSYVTITNNVFYDTDSGVFIGGRGTDYKELEERLRNVDGDSPVYLTRYPELAAFLKSPNRNAPQHNVITRNIFAVSGKAVAGGAGGSAGGATVEGGHDTQYEFGSLDRATSKIDRNLIVRGTTDPKSVRVHFNPFGEKIGEAQRVLSWSDWQQRGFDTGSVLAADAGFVAPESGDFRLRPDSPSRKIGFVPIPAEEIGLYKDTWRKTLPTPDTRRISLKPSVVKVNVLPDGAKKSPAATASANR
jgi:parallel beta-helix repeat protein